MESVGMRKEARDVTALITKGLKHPPSKPYQSIDYLPNILAYINSYINITSIITTHSEKSLQEYNVTANIVHQA